MRLITILLTTALLATEVLAVPGLVGVWLPPFPKDRRSPCPMLNSLANHGYLPRNGRNVSIDQLAEVLANVINLDPAATRLVGGRALSTSTTGNPETFNLDDINKHGAIEHDGSLSRNDIFFGNNYSFNRKIWSSVSAYFTQRTISIQTAADARKARLQAAAEANPEFNLNANDMQASMIETALYLSVFGDVDEGNAVTRWVKVMFEEERLPFIEGFRRSEEPITIPQLVGLAGKIAAASA